MTANIETRLLKIQTMEKDLIARLKILREEETRNMQLKESITAQYNTISDLQGMLNQEKDSLFVALQKE